MRFLLALTSRTAHAVNGQTAAQHCLALELRLRELVSGNAGARPGSRWPRWRTTASATLNTAGAWKRASSFLPPRGADQAEIHPVRIRGRAVAEGNSRLRAGGAAAGAAAENAPASSAGQWRPVLPPCPEPMVIALMLQVGLAALCCGDDWLLRGGASLAGRHDCVCRPH